MTMLMLTLMALPASALPQVGDVPPPLIIAEWVKGKAINLETDAPKKIHMIEFWATWCPPCKASIPLLTDYQKKYAKDLVIVGVTDPEPLRNSLKTIHRFVERMGTDMEYRVGADDNGKTWNQWLDPQNGIPYAFLLGRDGRIVWQGSPLEPSLAEIIPAVIDGSYDLASAKLEAEVNKKLQALSLSLEMGQWGVVWDGLIDVLKLDPSSTIALDALTGIYSQELRNTKAFRDWANAHIEQHQDNPKAMSRLAIAMLRIDDYATRTPDLAVKAARAAYQGSKQRDALAIVAYARSLYQIGAIDKAIEVQSEVVALVPEEMRQESQDVLDFYKLCKDLQKSHG